MTSVTQLLPNFIQGINDQPDELKKPGQVKDAVNVYPDVVTGLEKRRGYVKTGDAGTKQGYWFSMYRQDRGDAKRYLFNIGLDGKIKGWDADTGLEQSIKYYPESWNLTDELDKDKLVPQIELPYLQGENFRSAIQNDTAFINNKDKVVSMTSSDETSRNYEAFVEITTFDQTRAYVLNLDAVGTETAEKRIATKIEMYEYTNFGDAGSTPDCNAVGTYTITSPTETLDGKTRAQPIAARVTIQATPRLSDGDEPRCNYFVQETRLLSGGAGWKVGDEFRLTIPGEFNGQEMSVKYRVTENVTQAGPVDYPNITATVDGDNGTINSLLVALREELLKLDFFAKRNVQIVGNGLYLKTVSKPFNIDTSEPDLMNVLNNQATFDPDWEKAKEEDGGAKEDIRYQYPNPVAVVNNVSDLPLKCKSGFVAKVENTFSDDDDYYVRFVRDYGDFDRTTPAGETVYVETSQGYWREIAKPGEDVQFDSASMPMVLQWRENNEWVIAQVSWPQRTVGTARDYNPSFVGSRINNMVFYRNRLVFLSGQNVITSAAGDYTNFFPSTALAVSPADPVDLETNTNYSSTLHAGIEINNALVVFGQFQQFLLTTDSDVFDPRTAKLSQLSNYEYDIESEPFIIGTNVGFMGPDKMYEMTNIFREGQIDVQEKSKLVYNSFGSGYSITDSSKNEGLVVLGKRDTDTMWLYKYFKQNSQEDVQSAWFKWTTRNPIVYQFLSEDYHYVATAKGDNVSILRMDLNSEVYTDEGHNYETKVELPTFYVKKSEQQAFRSDTTSSLVIHRMHLNTGESNYYTTTIKRAGKDDYVVIYEQSIQDAYEAGDDPVTGKPPVTFANREETIPIYERNTNVNVTITADHNGPFTLYSLRWEGDYNNRFYKRI